MLSSVLFHIANPVGGNDISLVLICIFQMTHSPVLVSHLYILFGEMSVNIFCSFWDFLYTHLTKIHDIYNIMHNYCVCISNKWKIIDIFCLNLRNKAKAFKEENSWPKKHTWIKKKNMKISKLIIQPNKLEITKLK